MIILNIQYSLGPIFVHTDIMFTLDKPSQMHNIGLLISQTYVHHHHFVHVRPEGTYPCAEKTVVPASEQ